MFINIIICCYKCILRESWEKIYVSNIYTWKFGVTLLFFFIDRHLALIFYYFFLYTVFVCKFRPQESQSDVLGDLRRMISLVVGPYFDMPPLLLPGLEPATPGTPTVLTRVRCLSLKPDMDREVRSHPDSRISAKVQSWELGLSRVLRPDDHRNHPELRHVSSLHYRLRHQSSQPQLSQSRRSEPSLRRGRDKHHLQRKKLSESRSGKNT